MDDAPHISDADHCLARDMLLCARSVQMFLVRHARISDACSQPLTTRS